MLGAAGWRCGAAPPCHDLPLWQAGYPLTVAKTLGEEAMATEEGREEVKAAAIARESTEYIFDAIGQQLKIVDAAAPP